MKIGVNEKSSEYIKTQWPFVSVVMPVHDEAKYIKTSLESILEQDYPKDKIEIIVVDGFSTDGTREILKELQTNNRQLIILDNTAKIVPTGLNLAIRESRGEIIIRVDGHTWIDKDYIQQCVLALQRSLADNVGGKMSAASHTSFGEAVALATSSPFGVGGARFHYSDKEEWVDTVYLGAWRRDVFSRIGLFDEELVRDQDDEFNYRLRKNGGRILLSPKIRSSYVVRSSWKALFRQYFQYGLWKVRVLQKHPSQMQLRQFIPATFVASLLFSMILGLFLPTVWLVFLAVVFLYLSIDLIASIVVSNNYGWSNFFYLMIVYPTLHSSYGLGFLAGLVKFSSRWKDKQGMVPELSK